MKLIIAGTRTFDDYALLKERVLYFIKNVGRDVEIVSGGQKGADQLGEMFAAEMGFPVKKFPADWDKYGKAAGPLRNKQMAEYATHCICFWDNKSRGTLSMMNICKDMNIPLKIVVFT